MSEVRLNILDPYRAIHGLVHGSEIDYVVAALSAEPTTIEELQRAIVRFAKPDAGRQPFEFFTAGIDEKPYDAGIVFLDLAARVMASESNYSNIELGGYVYYRDCGNQTDVRVAYEAPRDWILLNSIAEYGPLCAARREQNAATPPLDTRAVLYDAVTDYIVRECLAARDSGQEDPIVAIHARWLVTPREDLRGQSPRAVLLLHRDFIDADLRSRENQWSRLGKPAPCLDPASAAYRFGGFGTHEIVVYYDLVRFLITQCWEHVNRNRNISPADEVARLDKAKSKWLMRPEEDFDNKNAAYIIECERKRLPLLAPDDDMGIDKNSPLGRILAGKVGPAFCHFDGSHIEDEYPFSPWVDEDSWEEVLPQQD